MSLCCSVTQRSVCVGRRNRLQRRFPSLGDLRRIRFSENYSAVVVFRLCAHRPARNSLTVANPSPEAPDLLTWSCPSAFFHPWRGAASFPHRLRSSLYYSYTTMTLMNGHLDAAKSAVAQEIAFDILSRTQETVSHDTHGRRRSRSRRGHTSRTMISSARRSRGVSCVCDQFVSDAHSA